MSMEARDIAHHTTSLSIVRSSPTAVASESVSSIVVSRLTQPVAYRTCALCWVGPCQLVGAVHRRAEPVSTAKPICSRCLVTFEMVAVQFGHHLRMRLDMWP